MHRLASGSLLKVLARAVAVLSLAACSDGPCVSPPCPFQVAAAITVTSASHLDPINGVVMTANGAPNGECVKGTGAVECHVFGGIGKHAVTLDAPGYQRASISFMATGTPGGCNRCEIVTAQTFAVTMQPATPGA